MTPFEDFLFFDSLRTESPADALTILHFSGRLDLPRFKNAIREAAKRSRFAERTANLEKNSALNWSEKELPIQIHHFSGTPVPENLPNSFISILEEPGVRFWIYERPQEEKTQIWFQFHHLTTDALGSFLFLDKIFEIYAGRSNAYPEIPDETEFQAACQPKIDAELKKNAIRHVFLYLLGLLNIFQKRPLEFYQKSALNCRETKIQSLISPKEKKINKAFSASMPVIFQTFNREETQTFRTIAHHEKVSLNDLLLAAVFQAYAKVWKKLSGTTLKNPILAAIPINLRKEKFQKIPLRNLVSVLFLTERLPETPDRKMFLQRIHQKMRKNLLKRNAELLLLELKWLCALRLHGDHRWGMKWFCRKEMFRASFVFSNLGVLFQFSELPQTEDGKLKVGNMILEKVEQASPRTTNAALTIAVGTYAGQLHFGVNHDPKRIADDSARLFLRLLIDELRNYGESFLRKEEHEKVSAFGRTQKA